MRRTVFATVCLVMVIGGLAAGDAARAERGVAQLRRRSRQPQVRAARSDQQRQRQDAANRVAAPCGRPAAGGARSEASGAEQLPRHAAHDRPRALQPERRRARGGVSSGHGEDALGAGAAGRSGRTAWRQHARSGLLARARRRTAVRRAWREPHGAQRQDRASVRGFRARRLDQPPAGPGTLSMDRRSAGVPRRRHRRVVDERLAAPQGSDARRRAGVRRADRQAAVDVPRDSTSRRIWRRHLERRLVAVHRARQPVVAHQLG